VHALQVLGFDVVAAKEVVGEEPVKIANEETTQVTSFQ
jgi:hypothetical protein